jgi:hypothetical protein
MGFTPGGKRKKSKQYKQADSTAGSWIKQIKTKNNKKQKIKTNKKKTGSDSATSSWSLFRVGIHVL